MATRWIPIEFVRNIPLSNGRYALIDSRSLFLSKLQASQKAILNKSWKVLPEIWKIKKVEPFIWW